MPKPQNTAIMLKQSGDALINSLMHNKALTVIVSSEIYSQSEQVTDEYAQEVLENYPDLDLSVSNITSVPMSYENVGDAPNDIIATFSQADIQKFHDVLKQRLELLNITPTTVYRFSKQLGITSADDSDKSVLSINNLPPMTLIDFEENDDDYGVISRAEIIFYPKIIFLKIKMQEYASRDYFDGFNLYGLIPLTIDQLVTAVWQ